MSPVRMGGAHGRLVWGSQAISQVSYASGRTTRTTRTASSSSVALYFVWGGVIRSDK